MVADFGVAIAEEPVRAVATAAAVVDPVATSN